MDQCHLEYLWGVVWPLRGGKKGRSCFLMVHLSFSTGEHFYILLFRSKISRKHRIIYDLFELPKSIWMCSTGSLFPSGGVFCPSNTMPLKTWINLSPFVYAADMKKWICLSNLIISWYWVICQLRYTSAFALLDSVYVVYKFIMDILIVP